MIWFSNHSKKLGVNLIFGPSPPPWHVISVTHFNKQGSRGTPLSTATYGAKRGIHSKINEIMKEPYPKFLSFPILTLFSCPFILGTIASLQLNMVP